MRRLIRAPTLEQQPRLRGCRRIGVQRINRFLRVTEQDGRRRKRFEQWLPHRRVWIVSLNCLQNFVSIRVPAQRALRLRRPVQGVLAQQRVVLRFEQPAEGLRVAVFRIVFVSERPRPRRWSCFSPRTPTASRTPRERCCASPAPNPKVLFVPLHPPAYPPRHWARRSLACSRFGMAQPWAFSLCAFAGMIARTRRQLRRAINSQQESAQSVNAA